MNLSYKLEQENEDIKAVRQNAELRGQIHKAHHSVDQN